MRCLHVSVYEFVWKLEFIYVDRTCWSWVWRVGIRGLPLSLEPYQSICDVKIWSGGGCIGSSGNVRKSRLAIGLSWWNMGKLVFPGEWRLYVKSLQLLMWSSFEVSCLGYPNQFIDSFIHSFIHSFILNGSFCCNVRDEWVTKYLVKNDGKFRRLQPSQSSKSSFTRDFESKHKIKSQIYYSWLSHQKIRMAFL